MTRIGLTTSLAVLAGVAAVIASCSDNRSPSAPGTPTSGTTTNAVAALQGGGWNPAAQQASQSSDRVDVCHTGDGKHYVQLSLPPSGADAHLGNPSSGKGGHDGDFRVSASSPCPPPTTMAGMVSVCKVAGSGVTAGTNFNFVVTAGAETKNVTVPAGAGSMGNCVGGGTYPVGTTVTVQETAQSGVTTSAIGVDPMGAQQGTSDLVNRSATIVTGTGMVTLTFTNTSGGGATGTLVLCKVAGTGITTGTNYTFDVGGQSKTVAAGAGPTGTCSTAITVAAGPLVVTEAASTGSVVSAITGTPTPTNVSLTGRSATIQVTAGQQATMTFTNIAASGSNTGSIVVCKVAGTGVTAGTNFTFDVAGTPVTVAAGAGPAGTCSTPIPLGVGNATVSENAASGYGVSAVTAMQGATNVLVSSDLSARSAVATVTAGQTTTVTFTNVASSPPATGNGMLVICKVAGSGVSVGSPFTFTAGSQTVTIIAGPPPTGNCAGSFFVPAGSVVVSESAVAGTSVSAISGNPSLLSVNISGRSATVQITAGLLSRVTFTNTAP